MTARSHQPVELSHLRTLYGQSAGFWAASGRHVVEAGRWVAFSLAPNVGLNTALCHGSAGGALLAATLADIKELRVPAAISVAGEALGSVNTLARANWVCVGATPLMTRPLADLVGDTGDAAVQTLNADDLPDARALIAEAFSLPPELSTAELPDSALKTDGFSAWGLYDSGTLVSYMGTAVLDDIAVVWSMATPARLRRRGYARRLLFGALAHLHTEGATTGLLSASAIGEPLYLSAGFSALERWQMWSRPRWMLAED